jgi:hypothetical protein
MSSSVKENTNFIIISSLDLLSAECCALYCAFQCTVPFLVGGNVKQITLVLVKVQIS